LGTLQAVSKEQSEGIGKIDKAINEMNGVTQRNASLSDELASAMSVFKVSEAEEIR
jgi:methyl-accepting chemotaxis protein